MSQTVVNINVFYLIRMYHSSLFGLLALFVLFTLYFLRRSYERKTTAKAIFFHSLRYLPLGHLHIQVHDDSSHILY